MVRQYAPRSPRQELGIRNSPRYGKSNGRSTVAEQAKARLLSRSVFVKPRSPTAVKNLHVRRSITRGLTPLEERVSNADAYYDPNYLGLQDPSTERWGGVDDDDDLAAWDEETTLVELLRDKVPQEDEHDKLDTLAEKLRGPMADQGQKLKQQVRGIIVPTIQQVKEVHETLENEVDISFGTGLLAFDEVCKRFEAMAIRQEDELKIAYYRLQDRSRILFEQLEDAYTRREKLWSDFEANIEECASNARASLESLPEEVEEAISRLEKKSKAMEKKASNSASKEKILKGLLERL